jgi:formylmethanofuran dehydrogenase subunit E
VANKVIQCDRCGEYALEVTSQSVTEDGRELIFCSECWAKVQKRSTRDQITR